MFQPKIFNFLIYQNRDEIAAITGMRKSSLIPLSPKVLIYAIHLPFDMNFSSTPVMKNDGILIPSKN